MNKEVMTVTGPVSLENLGLTLVKMLLPGHASERSYLL
jgi:hypothetical protein